jgi:hypothetical protein
MLRWTSILGGLLIMMEHNTHSEALFYYSRLEDQVPYPPPQKPVQLFNLQFRRFVDSRYCEISKSGLVAWNFRGYRRPFRLPREPAGGIRYGNRYRMRSTLRKHRRCGV